MPVLGERAHIASVWGEAAPCQSLGRGRALSVLRERARLANAG